MPTCASGLWLCDLCPSEREKLPRGWGGVGVGEELPLLIENFMEHVSWTVSHAQTEIQRPHIEAIFTKIKNYEQGYRSCPLPRSLLIAVDHDL
jgi:hypothetical protein